MLKELLEKAGDVEDLPKVEAVIRSMATGLFAAQTVGLVRFPARADLTIGEIESKLRFVIDVTCAKFLETADEFKQKG